MRTLLITQTFMGVEWARSIGCKPEGGGGGTRAVGFSVVRFGMELPRPSKGRINGEGTATLEFLRREEIAIEVD